MEPTSDRGTPEARHDASVSAARAVVRISEEIGLPVEPGIACLAAEQFRERRYEELAAAQAAHETPPEVQREA